MSSDRRSRRPLLRVADWPGCVQVPWKAARAAGSALFRPDTPGRALSANSWRIAEEGFGKLLAMLKDQELLASCTGVDDIVTEPHLTAMAECMQADGLAITTQITYLTGVAMAARRLSPKWRLELGPDGHQWSQGVRAQAITGLAVAYLQCGYANHWQANIS